MKKCILCVAVVLFALPVFAETYTWEDDQGTVNFTEDLGKVPAKYRKKVKIVGEEEFPPPEAGGGAEKPAAKVKGSGEAKEGAPSVKLDKKAVYGGKDAETWKSEFGSLNADLKAAEKQLIENRNRLKDTSGMSRGEYLGIQSTIKSIETSVLGLRKKLGDLKTEAGIAGVPAELIE
jgi:hypothetical protein